MNTNYQSHTSDTKVQQSDSSKQNNLSASFANESVSSETKVSRRGRKKKSTINEVSKLVNDSTPSQIEDFTPIKRSSRIQRLQEKKDAERKIQMELEQKRFEEDLKLKKARKEQILMVQEYNQEHKIASSGHTDDSDESFKVINKPTVKNYESEDSETESLKPKKKRGRKSKKDKLENKKSKLKKNNLNWSSNDEEFFKYVEGEEEEEVLKFDDKDDEFACEELEEDIEPVVLKRARTARKAKVEENSEEQDECMNDDTPCQKCHLYSNPEWILLCDHCDLGYHTECLLPKLYIIPDGDWYCPKCENEQLLNKLRFEFDNYVANLAKREREQLRKKRLKFVDINIDNILTEDSISRKSKAASKKKYNGDYDSELDDEEEDDRSTQSDGSVDFDSDDSTVNRRRRKHTTSRRTNRGSSNYKRRSRPSIQKPRVQRKRRRSYSDESDDDDDDDSDDMAARQNDDSSDSSLPKQRSARKRVSYQFKEYDELINSAIQASDYEDEYAENDDDDDEKDEEDEEEEDSDDGKSPYSKGKDIANLMAMAAEDNPFATEDDKKTIATSEKVTVNAVSNVTQPNELEIDGKKSQISSGDQDERKEIDAKSESKCKQKSKRKLNDLDSPVEEAENDSDFTIMDESNTEFEEDDTEMESNEFSQDTDEDDDTDLEDWGKRSGRRGTKSHRTSKRSKKRNKRYDSEDDESDYGYKTRRVASKRVRYREISSSEDFSDDYSDNSEKLEKAKKTGKKKSSKKLSESDDDFETDQDSDERTVIKKKKKKTTKNWDSSNDDKDLDSTDEEGKRKSKRSQKKKVYNDFTDIDESEEEQSEKETPHALADSCNDLPSKKSVDEQRLNETAVSNNDDLVQTQVSQVETPQPDAEKPVVKKLPKIKITKPNPKLVKNQNHSAALPQDVNQPISDRTLQNNLEPTLSLISSELDPTNSNNLDQSAIEQTVAVKKKRTRKPKVVADSQTLEQETSDSTNGPPSKRGRKPKLSSSSLTESSNAPVASTPSEENLVNVNMKAASSDLLAMNSIAPPNHHNQAAVLSQLTQLAQSGEMGILQGGQLSKTDLNRLILQQQQQLMANEVMARQAMFNTGITVDQKSQSSNGDDSMKKSHKSSKSKKSSSSSVPTVTTPTSKSMPSTEEQAASITNSPVSKKGTSSLISHPIPSTQQLPAHYAAVPPTASNVQTLNHHGGVNATVANLQTNTYPSAFMNPQHLAQPHVAGPPAPSNYPGYHLPPHFFANNQAGHQPPIFNHQPSLRPNFNENFNNPNLSSRFANPFPRFPMPPGYTQSPYSYDPYRPYSPYYSHHPQMANHHPYYGAPQASPTAQMPGHHLQVSTPVSTQVSSTPATTTSNVQSTARTSTVTKPTPSTPS